MGEELNFNGINLKWQADEPLANNVTVPENSSQVGSIRRIQLNRLLYGLLKSQNSSASNFQGCKLGKV
jgi:hypothetical protein